MSDYSRVRRQQLLREAEGYLELVSLFPEKWRLSPTTRDSLVQHALDILAKIQRTPANAVHVLFLTGHGFRLMERYREAVQPLVAAVELDPDNLSALLALGWCYKRLDRIGDAIDVLEQAALIDEAPGVVPYNLACYYALARNVPMAVLYLTQAFEIDAAFRERVVHETDFDSVRHDPHFQALIGSVIV